MFNPLNWLKGKHIDSFSVELAQEFASRYPLEMAKKKPDKKLDKKLGRALDHVYRKAGEFRRDRRLGIYGTARLGNGFKWQLHGLVGLGEYYQRTPAMPDALVVLAKSYKSMQLPSLSEDAVRVLELFLSSFLSGFLFAISSG